MHGLVRFKFNVDGLICHFEGSPARGVVRKSRGRDSRLETGKAGKTGIIRGPTYAFPDSMHRQRIFDIVSPIRAKDHRAHGAFARHRADERNLVSVPGGVGAQGVGTDCS
jgi:hypothetical protein